MTIKRSSNSILDKTTFDHNYTNETSARQASLHPYSYFYQHDSIKKNRIHPRFDPLHINRTNEPAKFRCFHASRKTPELDIRIDDCPSLYQTVSYKQPNPYLSLQPGNHHIKVAHAKRTGDHLFSKKIQLEPGAYYTLIVIDTENGQRMIAVEDLPIVPFGEAKIRFIHLSPETANLDIAVKDRDVVFPNLQLFKSTNYLGLTPMKLELEARKAGKKEIVYTFPHIRLEPNMAYTAIIANEDFFLLKEDPS